MKEEVQILMNIATAYCELEDYQKAITIDSMLLRSLKKEYMSHKDATSLISILMSNMAKYFGAWRNMSSPATPSCP